MLRKALIVTPHYPVAEMTGGNIRTMMFARKLAESFDVDLVYRQKVDGAEGPSLFRKETRIWWEPSGWAPRVKAWLRHPHRFPFCMRRGYSAEFGRALTDLIEKERYDLIVVRYAANAFYLLDLDASVRRRIVLDLDDVLSGSLYKPMFAIRSRYRVKRAIDLWQTRNCETALTRAFGSVVFCSEDDRSFFARTHPVDRERLFVVPNIVKPPRGEVRPLSAPDESRDPTLLFVGTLNYLVNRQGLRWFIKGVLPAFLEAFPRGRLLVVGRRPKDEVVELCRHPNIELHADVPSVEQFYAACDVVVVPLLNGSGTRLKILEAALCERPVVSTPIGAEGLDMVAGRDLLLFEDERSFVEALRELRRENRAEEIVAAAKGFVQRRYSLEAFNAAVDRVLDRWAREYEPPSVGGRLTPTARPAD